MRKRKRRTRKNKIDTSKKILIFCTSLTILVTCVTIILALKTNDVTPLEYLIPAVFGLSATCHAFYFWKAKAENLHKYGLDKKITVNGEDTDYSYGGDEYVNDR